MTMAKHVTVRMAWHDAGWNGTICSDPVANGYCVGSHSLLSERLAKGKQLEPEQSNPGKPLDSLYPEYLPPCYWTSSAFSALPTNAVHDHPFSRFRDSKRIHEKMPPYSVYTWPFRLSLPHSQPAHKQHGKYFKDLDERIDRYIGRLEKRYSLVFFYLNYDNPISAEEYKYALVGCALLIDTERSGEFSFSPEELAKVRSGEGMKNFPTRNWAVRLAYDFEGTGVRLPYQEYLKHVADHPDDEEKLNELRVLIEESALLPGFKYVCEQLNDDHCLFLLYKLRRAFKLVEKHGIVDPGPAIDRINKHLQRIWDRRGLYPGLGTIVGQLARLSEGDTDSDSDSDEGHGLVGSIRENLTNDDDLLDATFRLITSKTTPSYLSTVDRGILRRARKGFKDYSHLETLFRKLTLFSLTGRQVARVIAPGSDGPHTFGGRTISPDQISQNPYLLCESYVPSIEDEDERNRDLDREQATDGPIDYFSIDIGMFPDEVFLDPNEELQSLGAACPERLRAFIIEALNSHEIQGHSYVAIEKVIQEIEKHPLFHREKLVIDKAQLLTDNARRHFVERIHLESLNEDHFFYLRETWNAEKIVERVVQDLISASAHVWDFSWIDSFLDQQVGSLTDAADFDGSLFRTERRKLIEGSLSRRFFVVTGRPGAGKTRALREILSRLKERNEKIVVLAPTGKATLRLSDECQWSDVQTIDRWITRSGLSMYLQNLTKLDTMVRSDRFENFDTLIIDEMSMVHLPHLAVILRSLEVHQPGATKRIVLVGDEHQLPPIGCGRPFFDIINYLRSDSLREERHTVRLRTNCRQRRDRTVLEAAYLFAGKNRYSTDLWTQLLAGGQLSEWLNVELWKDQTELYLKLSGRIDELLEKEKGKGEIGFNLLLGLYDKGFVPQNDTKALTLDRGQVLSPYRAGHAGVLAINDVLRRKYRPSSWPPPYYVASAFGHSDKIIRLTNFYAWDTESKRRELRLSNGSIGVLCQNKNGRKAYFPESKYPFDWGRFDEDDFELAYAITVHKSQGSEFQETFVIIPERWMLLNRELVYTAMTRSKGAVTLFVQKTPRDNPLRIARERSALLSRNSSIFTRPSDSRRELEPEKGVRVQSKIEFLIYRALVQAREEGILTFRYEQERQISIGGRMVEIHPDFTIYIANRSILWEHLGMLDRDDYAVKWRERLTAYEQAGLLSSLVTTDDLAGVRQGQINEVIQDIVAGNLRGESIAYLSNHHYRL